MGCDILSRTKESNWEKAFDVVKEVLLWIVVTVLAFVWWVGALMLGSLILVNEWKVTFREIIMYTIVLTIITSICYLGIRIYRRFR